MTLSWPLGPASSVKLTWATGVMTRIGADFDTVGVAYQHRF